MNQRLALGLSVSGVLLAGSAAALVNTQILSANTTGSTQGAAAAIAAPAEPIVLTIDPLTGMVSEPQASTPATAVAAAAPTPVPTASVTGLAAIQATVDTAPPAEPAPSTTTAPTTTTPATSPTKATYRVGSAGSVTLDTAGDVLRVTSATPLSGWTVLSAVQESPTSIAVTFRSADTDVVFRAALSFGVVSPTVDSVARTPATNPSYYDDDDDDYETYDDDDHDEYDDDEHDDDEHDDDDEYEERDDD